MDARWYVVNVHSGCEKKVAESIKEQAVLKKMEDRIFDVMIPTEQIVEVKKAARSAVNASSFPDIFWSR